MEDFVTFLSLLETVRGTNLVINDAMHEMIDER